MLSEKPVIAVIVTCYNQEDVIGDAVRSVLAQATGDIDAKVYAVICDDGSTDNSPAILREFADENPEKVRVVTVTNRHVAGAINAALLAVPWDTEFVVTLGGDDWLADNFVGECLQAIGDADAVIPLMIHYANPHHGYDEKVMVEILHPTLEQIWEWDVTYAYGVALFRRSVLIEAGGFHPGVGGNCDWDMWIDFVARGYKFAYTDKTWFYYRYSPDGLNRRRTKDQWDAERREMRRHHRRTGPLPGPEWPNS
ncbi:MAG: glycosyltransferase family 2 protein [Bacteroidales bacterium]|nr:glycosyltransferase family 2 protein [Bacteroidales bacterium]